MVPFDIRVTDDLASVLDDWARLEETGSFTPFQTRAWLEPWYRRVAPAFDAAPLFVTVTERFSGDPLLLLPFCRRFDGAHDAIEFADLGVSDYNGPLIGAKFRSSGLSGIEIWQAVRAELPRADLVRLDKMPERIGGIANPIAQINGVFRLGMSSWGVELPHDRAAFNANCLGSTFLKEIRKKRRRIAGKGAVRYVEAQTKDEAQAIFATLGEMRDARFTELGRNNVLADPRFRPFYDEIAAAGFGNGVARVSALEVDGERVATMFGVRGRSSYHLLMSTFHSGDWKSCSPGNVAIDSAITAAIEQGIGFFDFTIGDEAYKKDFGASGSALYGGSVHLSLSGLAQALKGQIKGVIRTRLRTGTSPHAARARLAFES